MACRAQVLAGQPMDVGTSVKNKQKALIAAWWGLIIAMILPSRHSCHVCRYQALT